MAFKQFTTFEDFENFISHKKIPSNQIAGLKLFWRGKYFLPNICHQVNNAEKHTDERIPVDGFYGPSQTVFQFHGCFWLRHNCHLTKGKEMNEVRKRVTGENQSYFRVHKRPELLSCGNVRMSVELTQEN